MAKRKDYSIVGTKVEMLQVLYLTEKVSKTKHGLNRYVWCKCDCGKEVELQYRNVLSGHTKSCGCFATKSKRRFRTPEESARSNTVRKMRGQAKERNISWELTNEQAIEIGSQDCYICGCKPTLQIKQNYSSNKPEWSTDLKIYWNGIDRLDSSLGYTIENSRPCCTVCNKMKLNHSLHVFVEKCKQITSYQEKCNG